MTDSYIPSSSRDKTQRSREEVAEMAKTVYAKLQRGDIPEVFKKPEEFNLKGQDRDLDNIDPQKLLYRTSNSEYGSFAPSILEMPMFHKGKTENLVKQQNYVVYRSSRMNCELDKNRYINPTATIRRK
ncbi:hypothetical protein SS50377_20930 [Spironucleus salmonicida]|uniref:Uncharacterized protein n=1 Tax=Spironucleus salmonicida TaxID=348837 RepID=V6LH16_9EUKA|nr:hypothetical protein SS50377_20930 [Spironucleus salmonicida]|eukprot:EST43603.1 hypothetical protein SS50377_16645 [Spironucleus salmonicida]